MQVPISTSPGRSGFGPKLSLSYDSGSGNGPFGFGWSLDLPRITRKTDKGLPRYDDAAESDVFILSGAEDLVPVLDEGGGRFADIMSAPGFVVHRYRPRTEGLFARIERWTRLRDGDIHWRSISRDNILTIYGQGPESRIADPTESGRVFSWLICETRDDKGNAVVYEYKPEDGTGVDLTRTHERNRGERDDPRRTANRYLKRVRYGNRTPLLDGAGGRPRMLTAAQRDGAGWMFELVFDYGEHDADAPAPGDAAPWPHRGDAFSTYRAGFEVRTCRLCCRVLMFHHFPDEPGVGADCLVRSTDLDYSIAPDPEGSRGPAYTFLRAVAHAGYRRIGGGYLRRSLPPVEFEYSRAEVQDAVHDVDPASLENLPAGLSGASYQWTDLHGEGLPGILTEQAGAWFYKRNLSPASDRPVELAPTELVALKPNQMLARGAQFMDLAGDGLPDLVMLGGATAGLFEHDDDEGWQPFRPFTSRLNRDPRDPNLRLVDLDGDGRADVLVTEDDVFTWHQSLGEEGFGAPRYVAQSLDEEEGPRLVFADGTDSIFLADLSGDGLTDLVRIRNGEVCYWPSLGYGRFGRKITMDGAPVFDHPDQFDPRRVRLADIDGSGTTDIIYVRSDGVHLYFNHSGNGWSAPRRIEVFSSTDALASFAAVDLLGNGTACLVWSSPLPGDARRPMRYVDLMGGQKPHLLVRTANNLGAETRVEYAPSTKFYLRDKLAGRPWITRLPFPVHVVERVETIDAISGNRFASRYAYHHGYFDGEEREFRGFGMVEQWDTEEFGALAAADAPPAATNLELAHHVPPVLTRTWFHTGVYLDRDHISDYYAGLLDGHDRGEYYREPGLDDPAVRAQLLPDTVMPEGLTLAEERQAARALRGAMLRQEVYALDGTERAEIPYTVTEQSFTIRVLQPAGDNRYAVFFTHPREAISCNYERDPGDPRVAHELTLAVDDYGNVLRSLSVGYGRRRAANDPTLTDGDHAKQARALVTYTEHDFTNAISGAEHHRTPMPAETCTYELTGHRPEGGVARFSFETWTRDDFAVLRLSSEIPYERTADAGRPQRRLIERVRTRYRKDDLTALSPPGEIESLALSGESYKLALTPGLIAEVFRRRGDDGHEETLLTDPAAILESKAGDGGGYVRFDGGWWIPTGRSFYHSDADASDPARTAEQERESARAHFYTPRKSVDPFGHAGLVHFDAYDLLPVRTVDALGNETAALNDYRVLQPWLVTDLNRNRSAAAFDALGMVAATAVMGKEGESLGDRLEDVDVDPPLADLQSFVADPVARAGAMLGKATTRTVYDDGRYRRAAQPPLFAVLARETHLHKPGGDRPRIQIVFSYSDGFRREIQKKAQAEPGDAPGRSEPAAQPAGDVRPGALERDASGQLIRSHASRRWAGTGRTVFNNKGKPVRKYEPFFSSTHLFEPEREMTDTGVTPVMFYDPVGRVVATLHPNHTYEKVVFDPWRQATYDVNDTVAADPRSDGDIAGYVKSYFAAMPAAWETWLAARIEDQLGAAERDAACKAAVHADTPAVAHLDALGRTFLTVAHNRQRRDGELLDEKHATRVELDIEGTQRALVDAKGRVVMRYHYDLLANRVRQSSMEAGERWMLSDAVGKPIRAWDSRLFLRRMTYDELRRPTGLFVTENGAARLAERTVYGEGQGDAANHRGQIFQRFDSTGVVTNVAYDFKGNLREHRRELLPTYKLAVNWLQNPAATDGTFVSSTTFDALNRPLTVTSPDGSVYRPIFNEANLLDKVGVQLRGAGAATAFVTNIRYNAKGQREQIDYGNGATTIYEYDPLTFRLSRLKTTRPVNPDATATQLFKDPSVVQDLLHSYDPVGNITRIEDVALKTIIRGGQNVEPVGAYTYDAVYRLIEAEGREHIGQNAFDFNPPNGYYRDYPFVSHGEHPNDLQAVRNYTERYEYDPVGNFETLIHRANGAGWTRRYDYQENSLLEAGKKNNRLTRTTLGNGLNQVEPYRHDAHGNMTWMPHLAAMVWDFKDELQQADLGGGGTAYYVYDGAGQRVRKVLESQNGARQKERLYLGGFEIYREYNGVAISLERESLYVLDGKQRIALVETQTIQNGNAVNGPVPLRRYQFGNHLGSSSVELDHDGALIAYEEYHPYGTTSFQAGRSAAEVSLKRYRYTGKERDEETGLYYHGARYYAPWLARWAAFDPAGTADGPCPYSYARSNPVRLTDPNGMQSADDIGMAMMWRRMGQEFEGIIEGFFGGSAFVDPASNRVEYSGPSNGVGGLVGGVVREATFRAVPIEDNPSEASLAGMEVGGGLVPIAGPACRLITGETTTGLEASRGWAAVELVADVVPLTLEARAAMVEARLVSREARVLSSEAQALNEVATIERTGAEAAAGGRRTPRSPDPSTPPIRRGQAASVDPSEHSGPWVSEASDVRRGGAITQCRPGSCVSASGQMVSGGRVSEAELLDELGEWSNVQALRDSLNTRAQASAWAGGGFASGEDAVAIATRGPVAAELRVPGAPGHVVLIQPAEAGRFIVRDPLPGISYSVDADWIEQFVSAGVWRR